MLLLGAVLVIRRHFVKLSALQDRDPPSVATVGCIVAEAAPTQGGDAAAAEDSVFSNGEEIGGI